MSFGLIQITLEAFSTVTTFIASIVAWKTNQKEHAAKLSYDVSMRPKPIGDPEKNRLDYGFAVTVRNISNRPVLVESIGLSVETYGTSFMSNVNDVKLEATDIVRTAIAIPTIAQMEKIWPHNRMTNRKKVYIVVTSSIGKHVIKTKTTLSDLIKLRHQHPTSSNLFKDIKDYEAMYGDRRTGNNNSAV